MQQLTQNQAIRFSEEKLYEYMTDIQICELQLNQMCLCMPFEKFHIAVEKVLGRPVFSHEFAFLNDIREEIFKGKVVHTLKDLLSGIPKEKIGFIFGDINSKEVREQNLENSADDYGAEIFKKSGSHAITNQCRKAYIAGANWYKEEVKDELKEILDYAKTDSEKIEAIKKCFEL